MKKKAVVTFELVKECDEETERQISKEMLEWFREEAIGIPWVKDVKDVTVKGE
jgi:hypothetical protein